VKNLLPLAVGELDIKHPAVRFHHRQGIKFSFGCPVSQRIEVSPVDLYLPAGADSKRIKACLFFKTFPRC